MRGGHHSEPAISNQQRHTVGGLHGNDAPRVARQHDVRLWQRILRCARQTVGHDDAGTVHLLQADQLGHRGTERHRHVGPHTSMRAGLAERPRASGEEMRRILLERQADQRRAERGITPLESGVGERQYHVRVSTIIGLGIDATDIPRIVSMSGR